MSDASSPSSVPSEPAALARFLDANFNRAAEGLRVAEDVVRFVQNDALLAARLKRIRHALRDQLASIDASALARARNVAGDVGRNVATIQEYSRAGPDDLIAANLKRAQQSLRALEEGLKLSSGDLANAAGHLRYETYQLEHALAVRDWSRTELAEAKLYVLLPERSSRAAFEVLARELIDGGVDLLQLRAKSLDDRELLRRGEFLTKLVAGTAARWVMNDRADVAAVTGASGVHVGQTDLPLPQVRQLVAPRAWVGVSTHSLDQVADATFAGATYLGVGPTFASRTKNFSTLAGLELIHQTAANCAVPWFAIGGINLGNLDRVLAAGARRIAVGNAIVEAPSPAEAVRAFREKLGG
jgi:thiamine-phosphate pyrophosphorylase